MFRKAAILLILLFGIFVGGNANIRLEWERIENWTGEGENQVAVGIQFNDGIADRIYVYGYRWSGAEPPVCRDVMKAICRNNESLCLLEQRVSRTENGYALGGIGYGTTASPLDALRFDFEGACNDGAVTFNYYAYDIHGNIIGPGDATPDMVDSAIKSAQAEGHTVEHPIAITVYGAASYDYDHWYVDNISADRHWNSGWSIGNWVMWCGSGELSTMDYAGMGYGSRSVVPGEFLVWNFNRHNNYPTDRDIVDGYSGASRPLRQLHYVPANTNGIRTLEAESEDTDSDIIIYNIKGVRVNHVDRPGFYIFRNPRKKSSVIRLIK